MVLRELRGLLGKVAAEGEADVEDESMERRRSD